MIVPAQKVSRIFRISRRFAQCDVWVALERIRIANVQVADGVAVPASVALPFGVFERTLKDPANKAAAASIAALQKELVHSFCPFPQLNHSLT